MSRKSRRHHPKSRKERLALRARLGERINSTKDRVMRRVDKRGEHAKRQKTLRWKKWEAATE